MSVGDPQETLEWLDSAGALKATAITGRASLILDCVVARTRAQGVDLTTSYRKTIPADAEPSFLNEAALETRIRRNMRWSAAVMVARADQPAGLRGHLTTCASTATLYEINHFFRGKSGPCFRDQVFFQGPAAPGFYAQAYLEGRLTEQHLDRFRGEVGGRLPSYQHPHAATSGSSRPCPWA
jgi:pyruvate dehydrogenase E1 component